MKKSPEITSLMMFNPNGSDNSRAFSEALLDPANHGKSPKVIAIACGLSVGQMIQFYRDNVMAEALMRASEVMANKMEGVVECTLDVASSESATDKDRRLALELMGLIGDKKSNHPVNVNVSQANMSHPGFEDAAKKGTVAINVIPEE